MPFLDEIDEFPNDAGVWLECEDCGEEYNAMEEGECPFCDENEETETDDD